MRRPRFLLSSLPLLLAVAALGACGDDPSSPRSPPLSPMTGPAAVESGPAAPPREGTASGTEGTSEQSGREALLRVVRAETTTAFHGIRTLTQGPRGTSRETRLHVFADGAGHTLLEWPGAGDAEARQWTVEHRFAWIADPELLLRNYRVRVDDAPSPTVAWHDTRRLTVTALRPGRPSLELLVDAKTWVVLAESLRDVEGTEWRSARFESIDYGLEPCARREAKAEPLATSGTLGERPADWDPLDVTTVPAGFARVASGPNAYGSGGKAAVPDPHVWREDWSDGLAGFSVIQRREPGDSDPVGGAARRRRWLGGGSLTAVREGRGVTVCGTLSPDDLLTVLSGVRPSAPGR